MDKQLSGLDPKLKEIYDRVMNINVSQAQLTEAAHPTPQQAQTEQVPAIPQQAPPAAPKAHDTAFVNGFVGTTGVPIKGERNNKSMWMLGAFAFLFLIIYTFIWIKVFRLQLPISIPFINP